MKEEPSGAVVIDLTIESKKIPEVKLVCQGQFELLVYGLRTKQTIFPMNRKQKVEIDLQKSEKGKSRL